MSDYNRLDTQALDNWIMGVNDPNAPFNQLDEEEEYVSCRRPGKNGCGVCDACDDYQHMMEDRFDRMRDDSDYWRD